MTREIKGGKEGRSDAQRTTDATLCSCSCLWIMSQAILSLPELDTPQGRDLWIRLGHAQDLSAILDDLRESCAGLTKRDRVALTRRLAVLGPTLHQVHLADLRGLASMNRVFDAAQHRWEQ